MKARIGDVVIDKTYNKNGTLALVVGEGFYQPILINHCKGATMDRLRDYYSTWEGLEIIGHISFEKIWEEVVRFNRPKSNATQHTQCAESVEEEWLDWREEQEFNDRWEKD